jgi:hypothetical protein
MFLNILISNVINVIKDLRNEVISTPSLYKSDISGNNNKLNEIIVSRLEVIKLSILFLNEIGIYQKVFDTPFRIETKTYYSQTSNDFICNKPLNEYIDFVELSTNLENIIITQHLNEISLKVTTLELNDILIKGKTKAIFDKYYNSPSVSIIQKENSIFNENFLLLQKIYLLFKSIKIEDEIKKRFAEYITSCSNKIFNQYNKDYIQLYQHFILLKNNIDNITTTSFNNDEKFKSISKETLSKAINLKPNFIADYFSRYIDTVLTTYAKNESFESIKMKINEFIHLFKLLDAKDAFENFFIKKLANRCLYQLTANEQCQNYLIEELKNECGAFFVTKSEEMLQDITSSEEMSKTFNSSQQEQNDFIINYYVLSNYSWPIDSIITGHINNSLDNMYNKYFDFYKKKQGGKCLSWHLPYSNGEIEFTNNKGKVFVIRVNGVHAAILSCYNSVTKVNSIKQIMERSKLEKDVVLNYISDIVKHKILIHENDTYVYNENFDNENDYIVLIDLNKSETTIQEKEEVEERAIEERKYIVEAYIIKLLKPKKQMKLNDLITDVVNIVRFPCEEEFVKTHINILIDNGYISKDETNPELIRYSS